MVIDTNQTYCGDYFTMYTNKESCCTYETNILYVNYTSKKRWGKQLSAENARALPSDLKSCPVIHTEELQSLRTAFLFATNTSSTKGSPGSHGPSGRAAGTTAWICWAAVFYSGADSKLAAFLVTQ